MVGITNTTAVTMADIERVTNASNYAELMVNINTELYGGIFYFGLLCILFIIFLWGASQSEVVGQRKPMVNVMLSAAGVSIVGFFMRAITSIYAGETAGLLTDYQLWFFPLIAIIAGTYLWMTKR